MRTRWLEIAVPAHAEAVEAVSEILDRVGYNGIAVDLPLDDSDAGEAIVVELDPGMAFGTGLHPTTRQCLEVLSDAELSGRSLLDVGTGSGILAIGEQQDLIARGEAKHGRDLPHLIGREREIFPDDEAVGHRSTSETQSSR